jgi:ABC-type uncharacterized transport system YnjBCD ATPase subunit
MVVAEAFGLGVDEERKFPVLNAELKIGPTDIVYITGDSGSGKSVLLRAIRQDLGDEAVDMAEIQVDQDKPLIETVGATVEEGLELLSKVGLNDAFLFLRTYNQLSDGQKYRYRLAKFLESKKQWWLMESSLRLWIVILRGLWRLTFRSLRGSKAKQLLPLLRMAICLRTLSPACTCTSVSARRSRLTIIRMSLLQSVASLRSSQLSLVCLTIGVNSAASIIGVIMLGLRGRFSL